MRGSTRRSQRGAVLMVVLVALIAMMISVLALTRSMDTHQLVAGNLAFRNATVHSSDVGVQNAVQWLQGVAGTATLNANAPAQGYYAVLIEQNWDQEGIWNACGAACTVAADAAGNRVQWMIHRMCSRAAQTLRATPVRCWRPTRRPRRAAASPRTRRTSRASPRTTTGSPCA